MVLVAVEAVTTGSKPPAASGVRIFTDERQCLGVSAPLLTKASLINFSGAKKVWLFCRSWSNASGRHRPSSQKRYLRYALLDLLQRRPPCA